jgi:hypothetical protein
MPCNDLEQAFRGFLNAEDGTRRDPAGRYGMGLAGAVGLAPPSQATDLIQKIFHKSAKYQQIYHIFSGLLRDPLEHLDPFSTNYISCGMN